MVLSHVILACLVAGSGQSGAPPPQSGPPEAGQSAPVVLGPNVVSLGRIRKLMERGDPSIKPLERLLPAPPTPTASASDKSVATFRAEIIALQPKTFEEALKEALAEPVPSVNAGFLNLYPGPHRAGAGPGLGTVAGGGAYVHPSALIDWAPRLLRRRAVAKAREQVEAELQALLAAQQKAAEKPNK